MSGIELNKAAAAVLVAGLIAMVCGKVSSVLYYGGHEHAEAKRGYSVAGAETASDSSGAPAAEAAPVDILPLLAKADAAAGEAVSKKCTSCHTFDKGGKNGVGPNLWHVVGNTRAHKDDYTYSADIAAMKGKEKWEFQSLSDFLTNPKKYVPGTKMGFAGIKKPEDRANLIAYLNSLSDAPLPLPK